MSAFARYVADAGREHGRPGNSTRLMASSAGNTVPSERIASTSMRRPSSVPAPSAGPSAVQRVERLPVRIAERGRDDQLGELPAEHVLPAVAERLLGGAVELEHEAVVIDGDHRVEGGIEDRERMRRIRAQSRCRPQRRRGLGVAIR